MKEREIKTSNAKYLFETILQNYVYCCGVKFPKRIIFIDEFELITLILTTRAVFNTCKFPSIFVVKWNPVFFQRALWFAVVACKSLWLHFHVQMVFVAKWINLKMPKAISSNVTYLWSFSFSLKLDWANDHYKNNDFRFIFLPNFKFVGVAHLCRVYVCGNACQPGEMNIPIPSTYFVHFNLYILSIDETLTWLMDNWSMNLLACTYTHMPSVIWRRLRINNSVKLSMTTRLECTRMNFRTLFWSFSEQQLKSLGFIIREFYRFVIFTLWTWNSKRRHTGTHWRLTYILSFFCAREYANICFWQSNLFSPRNVRALSFSEAFPKYYHVDPLCMGSWMAVPQLWTYWALWGGQRKQEIKILINAL